MRALTSYNFRAIIANKSAHYLRAARWRALHAVNVVSVAGARVRKTVGFILYALITIVTAPIALVVRAMDWLAKLALPREYEQYLADDWKPGIDG